MNIEKKVMSAYEQHAEAIYKFCLYRVFESETAEDLVQETFLRFYEYLLRGKNIQYTKSFLYKMASNLIIDRSRKKKEVSLEKLLLEGFTPEIMPDYRAYDDEQIRNTVRQIEDIYRIPLEMRYLEGLKPKEIAGILGKSQNVISVRIYRGLQKLKKLLPQ